MLIFASQHLFHNTVTFLNYLGYVIAFLAVGMYNMIKLRQAKKAEKKDELGGDSSDKK